MPIVEKDPWRRHYFDGVACAEDVIIPTDDEDCYRLFPAHHWVYNKLLICETQGLRCSPHGPEPEGFPVFSKPIYNLRGMGSGTRVFRSSEEYEQGITPGQMWMPLLEGEHVSSDAAVLGGRPRWWRHTIGVPVGGGMFDYWTILAEPKKEIEDYCGEWLRRNLKDYTGMINFETIGGKIIECHLRFADQWSDLYGPGWVEAVVALYTKKQWDYADGHRRDGYSVVLFGGHGPRYQPLAPSVVAELSRRPEISSIQITFHHDKAPEFHAMPPGGFRLAIVNCWDIEAGFEARRELAIEFWSTQTLQRQADDSAATERA